jgi:hypothetical protein
VSAPARLLAGLLALGPCGAGAGDGDDPLYPAVDCAALWAATAEFRETYAVDRADPAEARALSAAFRAAAVALNGGAAGPVEARIAELRPVYGMMLESYILDGDRDNQDVYEWLVETCGRFAEAQGIEMR